MNPSPIGYQIADLNTDDPPEGMRTYEIYTLESVLTWLIGPEATDRGRWRLIPIFGGDIEEPTFPDQVAAEAVGPAADIGYLVSYCRGHLSFIGRNAGNLAMIDAVLGSARDLNYRATELYSAVRDLKETKR